MTSKIKNKQNNRIKNIYKEYKKSLKLFSQISIRVNKWYRFLRETINITINLSCRLIQHKLKNKKI